jgi:hypothetical protein
VRLCVGLVGVWSVSGRCLVGVWSVSGRCLVGLALANLSLIAAEDWGSADVKTTTLDPAIVSSSDVFACSITSAGCRIAKVDFDLVNGATVRVDGKLDGTFYDDVSYLQFSTILNPPYCLR